MADKYASSKLQRNVQNNYGKAVVIQTQKGQGKYYVMFSSFLTIAEAIQAPNQMESALNVLEPTNDITDIQMNEGQILLRAASILRRVTQSV